MSEDQSNFNGDFLTKTREIVASGESVYGPVGSPKQVEKLVELDARLAVSRRLGEAPPAPEPWTEERAAKERLAREFPKGDPANSPMPEQVMAWATAQFDNLGKLNVREQATLAREVADDFAYRTSDASMNYSYYKNGHTPTGSSIVEALVKDAEPAINHLVEPTKRAEATKLVRHFGQLIARRSNPDADHALAFVETVADPEGLYRPQPVEAPIGRMVEIAYNGIKRQVRVDANGRVVAENPIADDGWSNRGTFSGDAEAFLAQSAGVGLKPNPEEPPPAPPIPPPPMIRAEPQPEPPPPGLLADIAAALARVESKLRLTV